MNAFIRCRKTAAHAAKAIGAQNAIAHRRGLSLAGEPSRYLDDVLGETRFDRGTIKLSEDAAPIPSRQLALVLCVLPLFADLCEDRGKGNNLGLIWQIVCTIDELL